MPELYEICGDEAWTHTNPPLNRYWCFWFGLMGIARDLDRLETMLRACLRKHGYRLEVKWRNINERDLATYFELIDTLFACIARYDIHYRQTFLDRAYVYRPDPGEPPLSDLDLQFRICYQFLKHCFGLQHMPEDPSGKIRIQVMLDTHSSRKHLKKLREFAQKIPEALGRLDVELMVSHINSSSLVRIGVCDVCAGAAGFYGNHYHERRNTGQRGMLPQQKLRYRLAKHIYDHLRSLDKATRGSSGFNWFESTGHDGDIGNRFAHKLRIWKFRPRRYKIDRGWQNSHLDKQGRYLGPDLIDPPSCESTEDDSCD